MPLLELQDVTAGYGPRVVLDGLSLALEAGRFVALLGPNGAGKTTLLRVAAGILRPRTGRVLVQGRDLAELASREAARVVSGVAQDDTTDFAFTVREVAAMGRHPHLAPWRGEGDRDRRLVAQALRVTGLEALADRPITQLSGGERRRASLARCLAQDAAILLLDEPTSHLDLGHETRVLASLHDLVRTEGRGVLAAMHDVNLAALHADRVVLLAEGRVVMEGTPGEVLTAPRLEATYGTRMRVLAHPDDAATPVAVPARGPR